MKKILLKFICICLGLFPAACSAPKSAQQEAAVETHETPDSYYVPDAPDSISAQEIIHLETSFFRFDDRHNGVVYCFTLGQTSYGDYVMEETSALNTRAAYDADMRQKLFELIERSALAGYNGQDVMNDGAYTGEISTMHCQFDTGEILQFRVESDPYADWTQEFLELFEEAQKQNVIEQLVENTQYTLGERLCGRYVSSSGEEATYEISYIDGQLYLEYRSIYEYWGAEFEPDDRSILNSTDTETFSGTFYPFSGFSMAGNYWNQGVHTSLEITKDGLIMDKNPVGSGSLQLVRSDSALPIHKAPEGTDTFDDSVVGIWRMGKATEYGYEDCVLIIKDDGTVTAVVKESGKPVVMECGTVQSAENGILEIAVQRFAFGSMPSSYNLEFTVSGDDLHLRVRDGYFMGKPEGSKFVLENSEEGKRNDTLKNGPIKQRIEDYTVCGGFADDMGKYYLQETEGNGLYYIDEDTLIDAEGSIYAYYAGDDAVTWIGRLLDPVNIYASAEGVYDITVTGGHIDVVHGMVGVY